MPHLQLEFSEKEIEQLYRMTELYPKVKELILYGEENEVISSIIAICEIGNDWQDKKV